MGVHFNQAFTKIHPFVPRNYCDEEVWFVSPIHQLNCPWWNRGTIGTSDVFLLDVALKWQTNINFHDSLRNYSRLLTKWLMTQTWRIGQFPSFPRFWICQDVVTLVETTPQWVEGRYRILHGVDRRATPTWFARRMPFRTRLRWCGSLCVCVNK